MKTHESSLFVLSATSGSYEERTTWTVAVWDNEDQARLHRRLAQECADRLYEECEDRYEFDGENPHDPEMDFVSGDAVEYTVDRLSPGNPVHLLNTENKDA